MKNILESKKKDIRELSLHELKNFFSENKEKPFRAKQVREWLWKKSATDFQEMTNLSKKTREVLEQNFQFNKLIIEKVQHSEDGTLKTAFRTYDQHLIEGVLIPTENGRMTACISSQIGCSLTCKFCATGYMARQRNLTPAEIYEQVLAISKQAEEYYQQPLSNIVYMGMGEPLLNYQNVLTSVAHLTKDYGLGMASKRITISTAGIAKMIKKLGDDGLKTNLALSLHAANDQKRNQIMPINESNSLLALRDALKYFYQKTKNKVTYEYIVFDKFNDSLKDAEELYQFTKHLPSKINLIEYNPISEANYQNAQEDRLEKFAKYLENKGLIVKVRRSRGKDIDAACGQLANKNK